MPAVRSTSAWQSSRRRTLGSAVAWVAAAALLLALPACGVRTVRKKVSSRSGVDVVLRTQKQGFSTVERGFQHPSIVSSERVAHILGALEVHTSDDDASVMRAALSGDILYRISDGISQALASANPNQDVAVMAVRKTSRHGLFHRKFLTSLIVYMKEGLLYVHLSRVDWEIPKHRTDNLPEPHIDDEQMKFRLVPAPSMYSLGRQTVTVRWQDPIFAEPVRRTEPGDAKVRRRTILMDSPIPREDRLPAVPPELSGRLGPDALRTLADLEEERLSGKITESEYLQRRAALLEAADTNN